MKTAIIVIVASLATGWVASRLVWKLSGPSSGPPSYKSFVSPLFPAFAF